MSSEAKRGKSVMTDQAGELKRKDMKKKKRWRRAENRRGTEIGEKEEKVKDSEKLSQVYCIYYYQGKGSSHDLTV